MCGVTHITSEVIPPHSTTSESKTSHRISCNAGIFLLQSVRTLGERAKELVLHNKQLEQENAEILLSAGLREGEFFLAQQLRSGGASVHGAREALSVREKGEERGDVPGEMHGHTTPHSLGGLGVGAAGNGFAVNSPGGKVKLSDRDCAPLQYGRGANNCNSHDPPDGVGESWTECLGYDATGDKAKETRLAPGPTSKITASDSPRVLSARRYNGGWSDPGNALGKVERDGTLESGDGRALAADGEGASWAVGTAVQRQQGDATETKEESWESTDGVGEIERQGEDLHSEHLKRLHHIQVARSLLASPRVAGEVVAGGEFVVEGREGGKGGVGGGDVIRVDEEIHDGSCESSLRNSARNSPFASARRGEAGRPTHAHLVGPIIGGKPSSSGEGEGERGWGGAVRKGGQYVEQVRQELMLRAQGSARGGGVDGVRFERDRAGHAREIETLTHRHAAPHTLPHTRAIEQMQHDLSHVGADESDRLRASGEWHT